jgi:hypothetical protein
MSCRCCGKPVIASDNHPIHTRCIPKHWDKHAKGISASRCHEFKRRPDMDEHRRWIAGNASTQDFKHQGFPFEAFLRYAQLDEASRITFGLKVVNREQVQL